MKPIKTVAFIGLGRIGFPVAGHIAKSGYLVRVYNRSHDKASRWCTEFGGQQAESPSSAASGADIVVLSIGGDEDVRAVVSGPDGVLKTLKADTIIVDHTTTSAALAREMSGIAERVGVDFLDAPVSGGEVGAQNGKLNVMVGGQEAALQSATEIIGKYAAAINYMGPSGSGQLTKMINQICIAATVEGLAEAIHLGRTSGLDMKKVLTVLSKGTAQSWQLENRGPTMVDGKFDFGFAVDLIRKDLGICLKEARTSGVSLPVTALVEQFYSVLQSRGMGRMDFTSLLQLLDSQPSEVDSSGS